MAYDREEEENRRDAWSTAHREQFMAWRRRDLALVQQMANESILQMNQAREKVRANRTAANMDAYRATLKNYTSIVYLANMVLTNYDRVIGALEL